MKTIALSNQKGGVGKSTTAAALAAGLVHRGHKVLTVDMDPQSNLTIASGVDVMGDGAVLYDVFKGSAAAKDAITASPLGYSVMRGGLALAAADMDFTQTGREYMLREAMEEVAPGYDFAVIDTAPALGILTVNAMTAADGLVIPLTADLFALQGLEQLTMLISRIKKYSNKNLRIYGLLITRHNDRETISKALRERIAEQAARMGTKVFSQPIRNSVAVREAQALQSDLFAEAPKANATIDYDAFVAELLEEV